MPVSRAVLGAGHRVAIPGVVMLAMSLVAGCDEESGVDGGVEMDASADSGSPGSDGGDDADSGPRGDDAGPMGVDAAGSDAGGRADGGSMTSDASMCPAELGRDCDARPTRCGDQQICDLAGGTAICIPITNDCLGDGGCDATQTCLGRVGDQPGICVTSEERACICGSPEAVRLFDCP